jgi:hypothetical protein
VSGLGRLIAAEFEDWEGPRHLEEEIFGSGDPDRVAACVDGFCSRALGSSIERYEFFATSVMSVHGLRLLDGRRAGELWPQPHDRRFDFTRTADGAGWIDELAAQARVRLGAGCGELVVAHCDWRAEHVRFEGEEIVATYDWQSLALTRESELVGATAHAFTADWGIPQTRRLPTLDEARAFVADYEAARGAPFSPAEQETIDAAWVYATAYGARCEHSDARRGLAWADTDGGEDSYRDLLLRHGKELLA